MNKTIFIAALVAFALVGSVAFAEDIPITFAISGRLTDSSGNVLNGNYNMSFQLYNQGGTGGTPLWIEHHDSSNNITVTKGVFSILLGNNTTIPRDIFDRQLWLQMVVSGENITPRQPLTGVPYAFRANNSDWLGNQTTASYPRLSLPNNFSGTNSFTGLINATGGLNAYQGARAVTVFTSTGLINATSLDGLCTLGSGGCNLGLTGISATNVTAGTLPEARIPSTLALGYKFTERVDFTLGINATTANFTGLVNVTNQLRGGPSGSITVIDAAGLVNATSLTGLCTIGSGGCNLGLTGLSASNVTAGTLPEARIPLVLTQAYVFQGISTLNVTGRAAFLDGVNVTGRSNFTSIVNLSAGLVSGPSGEVTIMDAQGRINATSLVGLCNLGTGCGLGLTGISATNVTAGTLPEARIPLFLTQAYDFQGISALNVTGRAAFLSGINATDLPSNFSSFNVTNLATFLNGVNVTGAATFVTQVNMTGGLIAGPSGEVRIYDNQGRINATSLVGLCNIGSGCGWGLTGISAANVTAGTLPEARIPITLTRAYEFENIFSFNVTRSATFLGGINATAANVTGLLNVTGHANFTGTANFSQGINITGGILNVSSNITLKDGNYIQANGTIGYFNSSNITESGSGLPKHSMIIQGGLVNPTFIKGDGRADATINMSKSFRNVGSYALSVNRIYNFTSLSPVLPTQGFTVFPVNESSFNITYNISHGDMLAFSWIAIGY